MTDNAYQAMLPNISDSALAAALIRRSVYMVEDNEDTQSIDLQNSLMVGFGSDFFRYDPADTVTPHDGAAVLVDANGRRYKLAEVAPVASVLDRTATPPGSPSYGDAYLATAGASGDWAGHDDDIMVYLGAGWKGVSPVIGYAIYVEDEAGYYHYSALGIWTPGLGGLSLAPGAVTPVEWQFWGGLAVEGVLDTPPGSPSDGFAWLVGSSPTGAWVGHADEIAYRRAGAWEYLPPYDGAKVYDRANNYELAYGGGAWTPPGEIVPVETEVVSLVGQSLVDILDLGVYAKIELTFYDLNSSVFPVIRLSADNSTFFSGGPDYSKGSDNTNQTGMLSTTIGINPKFHASSTLYGFNKAVKTVMIDAMDANEIYLRSTAEVNNAIRVTRTTGTWTSGTLLLTKYRG